MALLSKASSGICLPARASRKQVVVKASAPKVRGSPRYARLGFQTAVSDRVFLSGGRGGRLVPGRGRARRRDPGAREMLLHPPLPEPPQIKTHMRASPSQLPQPPGRNGSPLESEPARRSRSPAGVWGKQLQKGCRPTQRSIVVAGADESDACPQAAIRGPPPPPPSRHKHSYRASRDLRHRHQHHHHHRNDAPSTHNPTDPHHTHHNTHNHNHNRPRSSSPSTATPSWACSRPP